ncbi:hypothetical protein PoB_005221600 [Plakobranchus ocellatus]|uniref:Uncharacterized protein n=1 Tax=Plakobranchus ocellatus TaxID=259542 RepID=A0AAV4C2V2_9GAST|nr:hypothetical protein PoB_005221600 [Plakobranchus ocellatus]
MGRLKYKLQKLKTAAGQVTGEDLEVLLKKDLSFNGLVPALANLGPENGVKQMEQRLKVDGFLGRDCNPAFSSFADSCENAATQLIRMAAEVLDPRGDEKMDVERSG